jgi:hypothetical protein
LLYSVLPCRMITRIGSFSSLDLQIPHPIQMSDKPARQSGQRSLHPTPERMQLREKYQYQQNRILLLARPASTHTHPDFIGRSE